MSRFRVPGLCPAVLPVVLVLAPNCAHAQTSTGAPGPDPAKTFEVDHSVAKQPANPAAKRAEEQMEQIEVGARIGMLDGGPLIWIGLAAVLLSVGAWVYVKLSATTDARKLALSDPWIRARLAEGKIEPDAAQNTDLTTEAQRHGEEKKGG